jgi:meso-butanediol dehydrogenase / (S,S)-butanediol dehydrogenase / diacetyl reductase
MDLLHGKVVLVTGAGKGSGRLVAQTCASEGAVVALNDLTPINLDTTAAQIASAGGQACTYVADIAKKLPIQGLLNQVLDDLGRLDIVINCSEVQPQKSVLEMDEWDWARTLDVNLSGAFLLTQSAARILREKDGGVILHMLEKAGEPTRRAAYLASKAGLAAMVKAAALEFANDHVKVGLLNPNSSHLSQDMLALCSGDEGMASRLRACMLDLQFILKDITDPFAPRSSEPGSWNAHQVLVHLRDVHQQVYLPRLKNITLQNDPLFQDFDGESWMQAHYDPHELMSTLLAGFEQEVEQAAAWLESLPAEAWDRPGTHPTLGTHPLRWWAERMANHLAEHLAQLRGE